jgi:hypothetical protein
MNAGTRLPVSIGFSWLAYTLLAAIRDRQLELMDAVDFVMHRLFFHVGVNQYGEWIPRDSIRENAVGRRGWEASNRRVIILHCNANLFEIVNALRPARRFTRGLHRRQQERHEEADDCNHDQELNQREPVA